MSTSWVFWFFFFLSRFTRSATVGFDCYWFWVMALPVMGLDVAGGSKLIGFA